jgi:hypothetical protein
VQLCNLCNSPYLETAFFPAMGGYFLLSWKPPLHPPHPLLSSVQRQRITPAIVAQETMQANPRETRMSCFLSTCTGIGPVPTHEAFTVTPEDCDSPHATSQIPGCICREVQRFPGYLIDCMLSHLSGSTWYIKCTVLNGCNRLSPLVYAILVQAQYYFTV